MKIKVCTFIHLNELHTYQHSFPNSNRSPARLTDLHITTDVDCSVGQRPVGALGLTWTDCPGQRASTEEKRFMDGACGQVIASPSL